LGFFFGLILATNFPDKLLNQTMGFSMRTYFWGFLSTVQLIAAIMLVAALAAGAIGLLWCLPVPLLFWSAWTSCIAMELNRQAR
jgi:hypothetical protein